MNGLTGNKGIIVFLFFTALFLRIAAGFFNYGFLALDDYYLISTSVPAQAAPSADWQIENIGFRSPLPKLIVWSLGQTALNSGFQDPLDQIRFIYIVLAVFTFPAVIIGYLILRKQSGAETAAAGLIIFSFYFLTPYVSSRTLLENMSAPFIMLSVFYLFLYRSDPRIKYIYFFVMSVAAASVFRFQAGITVFIILYYLYKQNNRIHWVHFAASGAAAFLLTGLPDLFLQNSFHKSLVSYFIYNVNHSSSYGVEPIWSYIMLFFGLSIPPVLISRYKGFPWKEKYYPLMPALWIFLLFVTVHSLIPHKEERFMLPVLPLFLMLITPAALWLYNRNPAGWRVILAAGINFPLLIILTFYPSQNNTIGLVRFFNDNHGYNHLIIYENSLEHLPISYAYVPEIRFSRVTATDSKEKLNECGSVLAVRDDYFRSFAETPEFKKYLSENSLSQGLVFRSSDPEDLISRLVPRNKRRLPVHTFVSPPCKE